MRCIFFADIFFSGELPKELGNLVRLNISVLRTIRSEASRVSSIRALCVLLICFHFFAGELPKELGNLVNLKVFNLSGSKLQGESYVPC